MGICFKALKALLLALALSLARHTRTRTYHIHKALKTLTHHNFSERSMYKCIKIKLPNIWLAHFLYNFIFISVQFRDAARSKSN